MKFKKINEKLFLQIEEYIKDNYIIDAYVVKDKSKNITI